MAILFSQADGSDQHYDTYEEFEQAFVLLKRLNGEKVPQDLMDEVSAKYGVKEPKPFQVRIDGRNFESAIREATRELAEALDETTKDRRSEPVQFEINGKVFEDLISSAAEPLGKDANGEDLYEGDYVTGTEANPYGITNSDAICEVVSGSGVKLIQTTDDVRKNYEGESFGNIDLDEFIKLSDNMDEAKAKFDELNGVELEDSPTEFRDGDLVRVMKSFKDSFGDVAEIGWVTAVDTSGTGRVFGVGGVLIGDNIDKLQLVCRKEDRKDIDL